jgi:hypothetical protein
MRHLEDHQASMPPHLQMAFAVFCGSSFRLLLNGGDGGGE